MNWTTRWTTLLLLLVFLGSARADLIVTISDAVIPPNQSGFVDVYVSGDGSGEEITAFNLLFAIEGIDNESDLLFADPQDLSYAGESGYVLAGHNPWPVAFIDNLATPPTADFSDATGDVTNVTVTDEKLLARLLLENKWPGDPSLALGDKFTITATASFFRWDGTTVDPPTIKGGTVSAVPEPGSFLMLVFGAAIIFGAGWRRHRTAPRK